MYNCLVRVLYVNFVSDLVEIVNNTTIIVCYRNL